MAVAADCNDGLVKEGHPESNLLKSTILPNRVAGGFSPPAPTTPPMNRDLRLASGSALDVSQSLSRHVAGVMNVHPQFFDRY